MVVLVGESKQSILVCFPHISRKGHTWNHLNIVVIRASEHQNNMEDSEFHKAHNTSQDFERVWSLHLTTSKV